MADVSSFKGSNENSPSEGATNKVSVDASNCNSCRDVSVVVPPATEASVLDLSEADSCIADAIVVEDNDSI